MSYERGLVQVGDRCWAFLQPDGSWGWSNAGLIAEQILGPIEEGEDSDDDEDAAEA